MRAVLLSLLVSGLAGIGAGAILRRAGWSRAGAITVLGSLLVRAGALIVFVSIAVVGFERGGWYLLLGVGFSMFALFGVVAYAAWTTAVLGGDRARRWMAHSHGVMTVLRWLSLRRSTR